MEGHKQLLLECVVNHLKSSQSSGTLLCNGGGEVLALAGSPGIQESNGNASQGNQANKMQVVAMEDMGGPRGRKRISKEDEDESEDDLEGYPQKQLKGCELVDLSKRFACPYFQWNSQGPRLHSACGGPGFPTMARLKYVSSVHLWNLSNRLTQGAFVPRPSYPSMRQMWRGFRQACAVSRTSTVSTDLQH
jgi:hypothetical protein